MNGINFYVTLEGLHYSEFWSNIVRATLERNFDVTNGVATCEASSATWNLGTNSAFALGSRKPRKTWSCWPVAEPCGCKLTSSQKPGIKYANPNISPYLCCCFIWKKFTCLLLQIFLFYVHDLDNYQRVVYNVCKQNTCLYAHTCMYLYFWLYKYWKVWVRVSYPEVFRPE
jgi:hypothetical protein